MDLNWSGVLSSIADVRRLWNEPSKSKQSSIEHAEPLADRILAEHDGGACIALAATLLAQYECWNDDEKLDFLKLLSQRYNPREEPVRKAAENYLAFPTIKTLRHLERAVEPPRKELLSRINSAPGGTACLVKMREGVLRNLPHCSELGPLEGDLRLLLGSWFNRGFLQLQRIDWKTSASILEKLIDYEAVHKIEGWDDLRRRLAPDRRCFAFFHPNLPEEPLIFVEIAIVCGMAGAIQPLLADCEADVKSCDTAIFYSISNCQAGLRNISFGNFLLRQVLTELVSEIPGLKQFATLSPIPGFRRWLEPMLAISDEESSRRFRQLSFNIKAEEVTALRSFSESDQLLDQNSVVLKPLLIRLCASYLTSADASSLDPVAKFHLGNGARIERINWMADHSPKCKKESFGMMVNYLYEPAQLERNQAFFAEGDMARSSHIEKLLR